MNNTDSVPARTEQPEDDPFWTGAVPLPRHLVQRLEALADEVGAVDPDASITGPVALSGSEPH